MGSIKSLTYFLQRGIHFEYESTNPGVPVVFGPLQDTALRAELSQAIDDRRGLSKKTKRHVGECDKNGIKSGGETFCTICRLTEGACLFCESDGLAAGELDCALCRLANVRLLREKGCQI